MCALQEEYRKDITLKEAEVVALSTLKQVMEEKVRRAKLLQKHCKAIMERQCLSVQRSDCNVNSSDVDFQGWPCQGMLPCGAGHPYERGHSICGP